MKTGNILLSAIHFLVLLIILSLGSILLALPYTKSFLYYLSDSLHHQPHLFKLLGGITLSFGLLLFIPFYLLNKRSFLTLKVGSATTTIDQSIVQNYIQKYWEKKHPTKQPLIDVVIKKGKTLEIILSIPENWEGEVEENLIDLENDLKNCLSSQLGYHQPFYLTLTK